MFEKEKMDVDTYIPELGITLGEELLKPTRIYANVITGLVDKFNIKGISHITGGGFIENIPRMLPEGITAHIDTSVIETPVIFNLIKRCGHVETQEMYGTFNMGVGMVLVVDKEELAGIKQYLMNKNEKYYVLGDIRKGSEGVILSW